MNTRFLKAAGAAGAGFLAYWLVKAATSEKRPLYGLVVWVMSQLPKGWPDLLKEQGWDFVSIKVCDGRAQFKRKDVLTMVQELRARDIDVHGWGFHYCRTTADALAEAKTAALVCNHYQLSDYHWNAEKQWAAKDDTDSAASTAVAFAREFRRLTAGRVTLWANCFSGPMTQEILTACGARPCYDVWEPMMYGTRPTTIDRHTRTRLNKFGGPGTAPVERAMMVGTGNIDKDGDTWGFFYDRGTTPGLLTLVQREQPYAVSYWRAPINLTSGNAANPSVARQLAEMRAATRTHGIA